MDGLAQLLKSIKANGNTLQISWEPSFRGFRFRVYSENGFYTLQYCMTDREMNCARQGIVDQTLYEIHVMFDKLERARQCLTEIPPNPCINAPVTGESAGKLTKTAEQP